ncbi:hypothetical protein E8E11_007520 [Didymella keratinophila]|nr:hypothetical protein E8E11_007520 [Didymella keratinophila]
MLELLEGSSCGPSPTDDALPRLNKDLPNAPVLPEIEPPAAEIWGPPIYPLKARAHHDELFYELDASYCLPPQAFNNVRQLPPGTQEARSQPHKNGAIHITVHELPGDMAYSALHHPKPSNLALLTRRSYLLQHGTDAQLAVLNAWREAENAQECLDTATFSRQNSPVPQGLATGTIQSRLSDEQEHDAPPIYAQFTKMRKWDFEEMEEAYNKAVNGIVTPPHSPSTKDNGGFEWFYGLAKQQ